jgi:hypothetical protein
VPHVAPNSHLALSAGGQSITGSVIPYPKARLCAHLNGLRRTVLSPRRRVSAVMLIVGGLAGDLVVGVEQGFGQEGTDVRTSDAVQHPAAVACGVDQPGQA